MTYTKHTPRPWLIQIEDNGELIIKSKPAQIAGYRGKTSWNIALISDGRPGFDEAKANTQLIAAAPDLLEALVMARECIAYCRKTHPDVQKGEGLPVEIFIDAALAKARGET